MVAVGRRAAPDAVFVVAVAAVVVIRAVALDSAGAPPGFDGGDWLALGHGLLGNPVRPSGVTAAPVVPLITVAAVEVLGRQAGFVLLGAASSVAPAVGVYSVLRRISGGWSAVLLSLLLAAAGSAGEAASWGGYPQLLGLGLLPPTALVVDRFLRSRDRNHALVAGCTLLAVALVSDLVLAMALCTSVMLLVLHLAIRRPRAPTRALWPTVLVLLAPLGAAVPLYARLASARIAAVTAAPASLLAKEPGVRARVEALWPDAPVIWRVVALAALVALALSVRRRGTPLWRLSAALVAPAFVATVALPEPRLAYFVPTAAILAVALLEDELRTTRATAAALAGVLLVGVVLQLMRLPATSTTQAERYQALTPGLVNAIDWLRNNTATDAVVVVTPFRDSPPVGWWTEGVGRRSTLTASSPDWVYFPSERRRAAAAARVLSAGVPTPITLAMAAGQGADYVLIDKRWSEYRFDRVLSLRRSLPRVVAFENAAAVILRTT